MFTKNCNRQAEPFMTGRGLCPVTGGKDNWSFTNGGLFCVYGDHSALAGWVVVGQASTGGMLYRAESVGGSASFSSNVVCTSPAKGNTTLQDAATLDLVYRTLLLLMACRLAPQHAENLRARGLKDVLNRFHAQERVLLASLPKGNYPNHKVRFQIIDQLLDLTGLSAEQLSGVPGFYTKNGRVRMSNQYGMLVPYYNVEGQIIGLQVRSDAEPRSGKPRYTWFSSAKDGGPRGGAPVGFLKGDLERSQSQDHDHKIAITGSRSQDHAARSIIEITEGFFKGLALWGVLPETRGIFYLPGVWNTGDLVEQITRLGISKARVWFDADSLEKPDVLAALARLIRVLRSRDLTVEIRGWESAKGKGIDDYLANGHALAGTHTVDAEGILRGATLRKRSAYLVSSLSKGKRDVPLLPDLGVVFQERKEPTLEEMRRFTRAAFVEAMNAATGTFTLLDAPTGGGKTTSFVEEAIGGTVYAAANYKQMFEVMEALEKAGRSYRVLYGRGRPVDETADAETQARQQVIWDQAGCKEFERAEVLGAKGYFPCTNCPLFKKDPAERAASCRYWAQRQAAMKVLGSEIVVTLAQTLASNHEVKVSDQSDLFETSKAHTLIFDDIADALAVLAPTQCVDLDDVEMWAARLIERPGHEEKQRDQAYRALVREVRACLSDPERPLDALYRLGRTANDYMDLEDPHWRMFKVKPEEVPPLNAVGSLALWLARGLSVKFIGTGKERALGFLRPSPLLNEMPKGRVIWMDATPNKVLMKHLAENVGMRFVDTNLPQPLQHIIQIGDLLWKGDQLDNHPEAAALLKYAKENDALIMRKKARATDGEPYFGRDERGLNAYKDAPFTVLEGHHAMRDTDAEQAAWAWGAWSAHCGKPAPFAGAAALPSMSERTFGDAYRRWTRLQHTLSDPLAENIRRHHYSTTILQAVARDRDPKKPKFVLSGSPIEYNGKPYPVTLWMKSELQTFLEGKGCVISKEDRDVPEHLQGLNAKRSQEKEQRIGEAVAYLETLGGYAVLKTIAEVRRRLGGKDKVRGAFAKEVWEALMFGARVQSAEHLTLNEGGHTETYTQLTSLCVPLDLEDNFLKTKESLFEKIAEGEALSFGDRMSSMDICTDLLDEAMYPSHSFGARVQSAEHLKLNEGGHTETYPPFTSLCVPLDIEDNFLKTNDVEKALFGGSAQAVGETLGLVRGESALGLGDGSLVEREDLDLCTGITAEADYVSDPPPFGLETSPVWEADETPIWEADLASVWEEDSALVSVPSPSPIFNAETASVSGLDAGVVCLEDVPVFGVVALEDGEAMAERIAERGFWPSEEAGWWEGQGLGSKVGVWACKTACRGTEEEDCGVSCESCRQEVREVAFEGLALGEIASPLPWGEEAANPPPEAKGEGLEGGEEKRRRLLRWWVWLGGVEAWRAFEESPNEATWSVLETLLEEMRRYVPDVAPSEMLRVWIRPPPSGV